MSDVTILATELGFPELDLGPWNDRGGGERWSPQCDEEPSEEWSCERCPVPMAHLPLKLERHAHAIR